MPPRLNPADYLTRKRVPVLDDHVLVNRDGTTRIDWAYLEDVAKNANTRYERTGDATPLVIGHTKDDAPEIDQPPIVGFATNFRVERFGRDKAALFADFHIRKTTRLPTGDPEKPEKVYTAETVDALYPRRSVELWVGRREIDPISLLGATTPERDLGLTRYSRDGGDSLVSVLSPHEATSMPPTRYESEESKETKDASKGETAGKREEGDKLDKVIAMLEALPGQIAQALASMAGDMGGDGDDDDLLGPAGGGPEEEKPEQYSSSAGGSNSYMPSVPHERYARQYDLHPSEELARYQRQAAKDVADLKAKLSRMEAEKLVAELEAEQVQFGDKDKDIEILASLAPDARKNFADHIRKSYKRATDPTKDSGLSRYSRTEAESGPKTQDEVQALIASNPKADVETILNQAFGTRR